MSNHLSGPQTLTIVDIYPFALGVKMPDGEKKHLINLRATNNNGNFLIYDKFKLHQDLTLGTYYINDQEVDFSYKPIKFVLKDNPHCVCCFPRDCKSSNPHTFGCDCGTSCVSINNGLYPSMDGWSRDDNVLVFKPVNLGKYSVAGIRQLFNQTRGRTAYVNLQNS